MVGAEPPETSSLVPEASHEKFTAALFATLVCAVPHQRVPQNGAAGSFVHIFNLSQSSKHGPICLLISCFGSQTPVSMCVCFVGRLATS